jgi:Tfp pilus assembly ATPase PilU
MQTIDQALAVLVKNEVVSIEEALMNSANPVKLRKFIETEGGAFVFPASSQRSKQ